MNDSVLKNVIATFLADVESGNEPDRYRLLADHSEIADQLRDFFANYDRMQQQTERPDDPYATNNFDVSPETKSNQHGMNGVGNAIGVGGANGVGVGGANGVGSPFREHRPLVNDSPDREKDSRPLNVDRPFNMAAPHRSSMIGPYKLLQRIGVGGMGEVWMAEQEKPVRRRVALKLIKPGMDSLDYKEVVARFEAERQALAMMDHQNIAKVLDAGSTEDGQPYFVMELVQGIPFNQYCDQNKLSINDRLNLFIPMCKAVQHAYQKGIIHRDLKPSNILVTLYDGRPVPKVIDFGLAKALQHQSKLTDKTLFTEFGKVVGTLQYMSPEQTEMNALDIDTRTDIYSLGVLLYELLTGSTPIEIDSLRDQAIFKVLETIREKDPPRPSARLSSSGDKITGISQQRQKTLAN